MDMTISVVWLAVAIIFITAVVSKISNGRLKSDSVLTRPPPPLVKAIDLLKVIPSLYRKDPEAAMTYLYNKFGSVFTVRFFGNRITFMVGHEVSGTFFHGMDSEVSTGSTFGKDHGYAVDHATRVEQSRSFIDSLRPSQLRSHVDPMLREVEEYFAKWGEEGLVNLKQEFTNVLMLIASRFLPGNEVREKIFGEFYALFANIEAGLVFAGKHTSTITSAWTGACLFTHPKFLAAALQEQKHIMRKYEDLIDYNVLSDMEILHNYIQEVGRLYQAVPLLLRKAMKNIPVQTEGHEYSIPKGDTLAHSVMLTSKLSHVYKDPQLHDPDLVLEERRIKFWVNTLKLTSPFPKPHWTKFVVEPEGNIMVSFKRRLSAKQLTQIFCMSGAFICMDVSFCSFNRHAWQLPMGQFILRPCFFPMYCLVPLQDLLFRHLSGQPAVM